jgi:hypothetical protein
MRNRLALALSLALAVSVAAAAEEPSKPPKGYVRGVVRDRGGKPLSFVQVWCTTTRGFAQETRDDGAFAFDDLPATACTVEATLLGTPDEKRHPEAKKTVVPNVADLVLVVDRGAEVVIRAPGLRFPAEVPAPPIPEGEVVRDLGDGGTVTTQGLPLTAAPPSISHGATRLHLETAAGWVEYFAAVQDGDIAFRRVQPHKAWRLYVAWHPQTKGTYYGSGERLSPGVRLVTLEPGKPITGTAKVPPPPDRWSGPPRDHVHARRGPVDVPGWIERDGTFRLPPLPAGPWTVSVHSGRRVAAVEAEPGATLTLEPK